MTLVDNNTVTSFFAFFQPKHHILFTTYTITNNPNKQLKPISLISGSILLKMCQTFPLHRWIVIRIVIRHIFWKMEKISEILKAILKGGHKVSMSYVRGKAFHKFVNWLIFIKIFTYVYFCWKVWLLSTRTSKEHPEIVQRFGIG